MEDWLSALKAASSISSSSVNAAASSSSVPTSYGASPRNSESIAPQEEFEDGQNDQHDFLCNHHHWYATSHIRPTYCSVCRDALSGVTSHGLSCEVCKAKVHKRCAAKAIANCKWTTLSSVGKDIIEDQEGNLLMPHQWHEGNLPVASTCAVCKKNCGSVLRCVQCQSH